MDRKDPVFARLHDGNDGRGGKGSKGPGQGGGEEGRIPVTSLDRVSVPGCSRC